MDPIEHYVTRVSRSIGGPDELRAHLRQELRSHIEDIIEELVASGISRDEATTQAIASIGAPDDVREGFEAVHGRRHMAFLIEKAMDWRERNMKTYWKWTTVATMLLVLCLALNTALFWFVVEYILPQLDWVYEEHQAVMPPIIAHVFKFGHQAVYNWFYPAVLVLGIWALFEWKIKSENKSLMRLTGGVALNLILAGMAAYISVIAMVGLGMATRL